MERISEYFKERASKLKEQLEEILQSDGKLSFQEERKTPFSLSTDTQTLSELSAPESANEIERNFLVFSRLTDFFDAGILLAREKDQWLPISLFRAGEMISPQGSSPNSESSLNLPPLTLPSCSPQQVLRIEVQALQKKYPLDFLQVDEGCEAFLLRPSPDFSFVLILRLAEPWLERHIEGVHSQVKRLLVD